MVEGTLRGDAELLADPVGREDGVLEDHLDHLGPVALEERVNGRETVGPGVATSP